MCQPLRFRNESFLTEQVTKSAFTGYLITGNIVRFNDFELICLCEWKIFYDACEHFLVLTLAFLAGNLNRANFILN